MRVNRVVVLLVLAAAASAQEPAASPKTAALGGLVRDVNGHPLAGVRLAVDSTPLEVFSSDSGTFFLAGIPAGKVNFSVTKLGFVAVHFQVAMAADTTLMVNIPMKTVQTLTAVDVKGEQVSARLIRAGYYERRNQGLGSFIGPDKIEKLSWASVPSTFLRDARGVRVNCKGSGLQGCSVRMGTQVDVVRGLLVGCTPTIFVNGSKRTGEFDEVVSAGEVYAIETYERQSLVPSEYYPAGCVIAVWTWTFADVPRPKK